MSKPPMSVIEQAAKRLEQLRRAGIEVPTAGRPVSGVGSSPEAHASSAREQSLRTGHSAPQGVHQLRKDADTRSSRLVNVDTAHLAASGFVSPDVPRSQIADEYRVIKRPLLLQTQSDTGGPSGNRNLIMVTSSVPGEGKTFTSINLALSIAMELDNTVLLVDADVSRPAVLQRLGLERSKGLLDLLTNSSLELPDVLLRTNIERLTILPAGSPQDHATELLASDAMAALLSELASRYPERILIFDAPPLLASTESRVLASHMGQVILVVEAQQTPQSVVTQALATIEDCPLVTTLLNKVARSEVGSYYGYYGNPPA